MDKPPVKRDREKITAVTEIEPPTPVRRHRWPWIALAAVVILAAFFSYTIFLSPRAQARRSFNRAVSAFEHKNTDGVLDFISDSYKDDSDNTKEMFGKVIPALFEHFDRINVRITRRRVEITGHGKAVIEIRGVVTLEKGDPVWRFLLFQ